MSYLKITVSTILSCVAVMALPQQSWAQQSGEIALSDESIQLRYLQELTRIGSGANELGFGLFWNENRDFIGNASYYVEATQLRFNRLSLMAGPVAYAAMLNTENTDVFGVAVGAEARFELLRRMGLDIVGRAAYAPDILTFGAADNIWDVTARAELPLTERITGFGGYRLIEIDLLEGTTEVEESIHLGIRYQF